MLAKQDYLVIAVIAKLEWTQVKSSGWVLLKAARMNARTRLSAAITFKHSFLVVGRRHWGLGGGGGVREWKQEGKHKSGLLSTATEIDGDRGVNFCLFVQRWSDLIRRFWGEGSPAGQWRLHCLHFLLERGQCEPWGGGCWWWWGWLQQSSFTGSKCSVKKKNTHFGWSLVELPWIEKKKKKHP